MSHQDNRTPGNVVTALLVLLAAVAWLTGPLSVPVSAHARAGACDPGDFCAWTDQGFGGERHSWDVAGAGIESCVALFVGAEAGSFANRVGRPVTVYQDRECGTEGKFDTYPGGGTWVPQSPYTVRAFKIWES